MDRLRDSNKSPHVPRASERLSSWKEIATHLDVSVRTAQRWEKQEGLPVHRHKHPGGATVFALQPELDAWRQSRYSSMGPANELLDTREPGQFAEGITPELPFESPSGPSIAILPFVNFSDDVEDAYFSDGLAEEIINRLTRIPELHVTARTSSFAFRGKEQDIREIGARLNVATILEGSLARIGRRIRITVQLISSSDGYHLWSELYDRELTDVFSIQDEICRAVVEKLRVQLQGTPEYYNRHSRNMEAYTLFLQGHYHLYQFTPAGLETSLEYYERAIVLDPGYALAYAGIGMYHWMRGFLCLVSPQEAFSCCESAVLKSLEVDSSIAEAHTLQGCIHVLRDFNWEAARQAFQRALELDSVSVDSRDLYNFYYLLPRGRLKEALEDARLELPRDPLSPWLHFRLGYRSYLQSDFNKAESCLRKSLELNPEYCAAYWVLGNCCLLQGMPEKATAAYEKHSGLSGRGPWALGTLGYGYARSGRTSEAQNLLAELESLSRTRYVAPSSFAQIWLGLGETDRGFECLEKAVEERDGTIIHIAVDPFYDFIRPDPRFRALLRKMNL